MHDTAALREVPVYWLSKAFHRLRRFRRELRLFLAVLGPGIIEPLVDHRALLQEEQPGGDGA
jgi:hypothetical protein